MLEKAIRLFAFLSLFFNVGEHPNYLHDPVRNGFTSSIGFVFVMSFFVLNTSYTTAQYLWALLG